MHHPGLLLVLLFVVSSNMVYSNNNDNTCSDKKTLLTCQNNGVKSTSNNNNQCIWKIKNVCKMIGNKRSCISFSYGCVDSTSFCDYNGGTAAQRKRQCLTESNNCMFN